MFIINTARRYKDLDYRSVSLGLFEDGKIKSIAHYDKEGYLSDGWTIGLYEPDDI